MCGPSWKRAESKTAPFSFSASAGCACVCSQLDVMTKGGHKLCFTFFSRINFLWNVFVFIRRIHFLHEKLMFCWKQMHAPENKLFNQLEIESTRLGFYYLLTLWFVSRHATSSVMWRDLTPADSPRMLHGGSAPGQQILASYQLHCQHLEDVWSLYRELLAWRSQNRYKTKPSSIFSCVPAQDYFPQPNTPTNSGYAERRFWEADGKMKFLKQEQLGTELFAPGGEWKAVNSRRS